MKAALNIKQFGARQATGGWSHHSFSSLKVECGTTGAQAVLDLIHELVIEAIPTQNADADH
jgi:hypothetical protein